MNVLTLKKMSLSTLLLKYLGTVYARMGDDFYSEDNTLQFCQISLKSVMIILELPLVRNFSKFFSTFSHVGKK